MKKKILMMSIAIALIMPLTSYTINAQEKKEQWPGVIIKILTDNEKVNISELTIAPGAVADWHTHPQFTTYALTDAKIKMEIEGKETIIVEMKAGQASWSPSVNHRITNVGKSYFTVIVTEIK